MASFLSLLAGAIQYCYEQQRAQHAALPHSNLDPKWNIGGIRAQYWTATEQRAEPAGVHSSTGPHQQEDCDKGCHEESPLCRRPGPGGEQELRETQEEWKRLITRHGLQINLDKTEVLHIGHQREELGMELEGKKLTQGDSFAYLGWTVCGDGRTREREVRRRAQAAANARRAVEGVMADRWISKRLKGKVMSSCVTPVFLYGTETLAMTNYKNKGCKCTKTTGYENSKSNEGRQENNGGVISGETGVQRSLTERLVRSRLQ